MQQPDRNATTEPTLEEQFDAMLLGAPLEQSEFRIIFNRDYSRAQDAQRQLERTNHLQQVQQACDHLANIAAKSAACLRPDWSPALQQVQETCTTEHQNGKMWNDVLMLYARLSRKKYKRKLRIRDDIPFRLSAIQLIGQYINHQCSELEVDTLFCSLELHNHAISKPQPMETRMAKIEALSTKMRNFCDQLFRIMHDIMLDRIELKLLALARADFCDRNAIVLTTICRRLQSELMHGPVEQLVDRDSAAVVLIGGTLVLSKWYRLQRTSSDIGQFHAEIAGPLVVRLRSIHKYLSSAGPSFGELLYERFSETFDAGLFWKLYEHEYSDHVLDIVEHEVVEHWKRLQDNKVQ